MYPRCQQQQLPAACGLLPAACGLLPAACCLLLLLLPGFVSGTLDIPAACGPGAPARACTTCQQVSDPVTCLACYNTTSNDPGSLVFRGQPKERQPQDNCPFCVGVQALERCVACIKNASEPCNACPTSVSDLHEEACCIVCVAAWSM
jgi:hypothetical protein